MEVNLRMDVLGSQLRWQRAAAWMALFGAVLVSYALSFGLKLGAPASQWQPWFGQWLPSVALVKLVTLGLFGVHRRFWRDVGYRDLVESTRALSSASGMLALLGLVAEAPLFAYALLIIDFIVSGVLLLVLRTLPRVGREFLRGAGRISGGMNGVRGSESDRSAPGPPARRSDHSLPMPDDLGRIDRLVRGRVVLITGAGGLLGSELARRMIGFGPAELLLLDMNENALAELDAELGAQRSGVTCRPVLCNVQDAAKLEELFDRSRPDLVFHTTTYKNAAILDVYPEEAIRNDVRGARYLARLACRYRAKRFVLLSSDQAVRPTSVAAATQRVVELLLAELVHGTDTSLAAIRLDNSAHAAQHGDQLLRRQLVQGRALWQRHSDSRESSSRLCTAAHLVLCAAAMDRESRTYGLELGADTHDLWRGREGVEKFWAADERPEPTAHPQVFHAQVRRGAVTELERRVDILLGWADEGNREQVIRHLQSLVPSFEIVGLTSQVPLAPSRVGAVAALSSGGRVASSPRGESS